MTDATFTSLYNETSGKVLSGIMRIVQNEAVAEEILQETYLQFLQIAQKEEVQWTNGLLFRISHNLAVDHLRKNSRTEARAELGSEYGQTGGGDEAEYRVLRQSIVERLEREDGRLLKFYVLTVDYAMHIDEVARELAVSRRSAFRLRDQLKTILAEFL
jgi:DNA-directed RNA polymerase specialized sigma24 family protein